MANPALRPRFLAPGDRLGKFDLIRQIAVGGMAELYLARTMGIEGFEKLVVVKRILPQYAENQSFVNMFLNEARLSATLHHSHITQVYDIGVEDGDYFFSMEYVHGEDLGRTIVTATENGVPLSLDAALTVIVGLCAGLHYAHEKAGPDGVPLHVVHRDVSPSNVLVSYDGGVKLVDFGIARAGSQPAQTRGGLKGKISYMSPEQCRGKAALDRRSDVFSIGTILYELTTGQLPFTDETEYGVLNQIVNTDAARPTTLVPSYPPALEAIVMKALARDVEQRYRTALELQKDLEDFAHENRQRISPLVLARLMSTLFPARLEEWDHARAQGAFFVEQHVVRTLIESGKTSDNTNVAGKLANLATPTPPPPAPKPQPAASIAPASDEEITAVTTVTVGASIGMGPTGDGRSPFGEDSTQTGASSLASDLVVTVAEPIGRPSPLPPARPTPPPAQARSGTPAPRPNPIPAPLRPAAPVVMPMSAVASTVEPPRSSAALSETPGQPVALPSAPGSLGQPNVAPSAVVVPPKHTPPSRAATPFPQGVPIMGQSPQPTDNAETAAPRTPSSPMYGAPAGGVLVSNPNAVPDAAPVTGAPSIDVTERVRVPRAQPKRIDDGAAAPPRRSRVLFIGAGVTATVLAAAIAIMVLGTSSKATKQDAEPPVAEPAVVEQKTAEPTAEETPEPVAVEPVAVEPVAVEPVAVEPVAVEPAAEETPEPVAVEPVVAEPKVTETKATPKVTKTKATPKVTKTAKKPEKKPEKKPDPKPRKDPAWNEESPFMPVRTDKR